MAVGVAPAARAGSPPSRPMATSLRATPCPDSPRSSLGLPGRSPSSHPDDHLWTKPEEKWPSGLTCLMAINGAMIIYAEGEMGNAKVESEMPEQ
jgi:hypothetical protein